MISSLFGRRKRSSHNDKPGLAANESLRLFLHGQTNYLVDAVGLSRHLEEIRHLLKSAGAVGARYDCIATLVLSDAKPHEGHTVAVMVSRRTIGFVPNHLSTRYREWLHEWRFSDAAVHCNAAIIGNWNADKYEPRTIAVKLDIELPFKVTTIHTDYNVPSAD